MGGGGGGYAILSDEGGILVSLGDGNCTSWYYFNTTRPVSFIAKLFIGNTLLLGNTVSSNILTRSKIK